MAYSIKDIGIYTEQPFLFSLTSTTPIALKPYPYRGVKLQFIKEQTKQLLEYGIIEEVQASRWSFPIVVVPKPHLTAE